MPNFKIRTYEEEMGVVADEMVISETSERVTFITGGKVTASFSRYLWVQEVQDGAQAPVSE